MFDPERMGAESKTIAWRMQPRCSPGQGWEAAPCHLALPAGAASKA